MKTALAALLLIVVVSLSDRAVTAKESTTQYKVVHKSITGYLKDIEKKGSADEHAALLNQMAEDGWELVAVTEIHEQGVTRQYSGYSGVTRYFFKRKGVQ